MSKSMVRRPCAVWTLTWRCILKRSRINVGQVVEDSARLPPVSALQHDGSDEDFTSTRGTRSVRFMRASADGHAELLLLVKLAELAGKGLGDFIGDHFEGGGEGVSGADGAGESVNGFGEKVSSNFSKRFWRR